MANELTYSRRKREDEKEKFLNMKNHMIEQPVSFVSLTSD